MESVSLIRNSLFFDNTCELSGAAVNAKSSEITITGSTFTQNEAMLNSGAIHALKSSMTISGSILWANIPDEMNLTETDITVAFSDISGGYDGDGNVNSDPVFAAPDNLDFSLSADSPCVGTGDPEATEETHGETDLAGNYRLSCFTIDMGAFELPEPICSGQAAAPTDEKGSGGGGCFIKAVSASLENPGEIVSIGIDRLSRCFREVYNKITEE